MPKTVTAIARKITTALVKRSPGRPPKAFAISGDKTLVEHAKSITEYHYASGSSAAQAVLYAILAGMELIAAKKKVGQGNWCTWIERNFPFAERTAYKYIELAQAKTKEIPKLQQVAGFALGVSPNSLLEPQRKKLIEAVKDATDGESLRQCYLNFDIIKGPRDYDHLGGNAPLRAWLAEHYPQCKARSDAELTDAKIRSEWQQHEAQQRAQLAERKNMLDRNTWNTAVNNLFSLVEKRKFAILTRPELERTAALLQDMRSAVMDELKKSTGGAT